MMRRMLVVDDEETVRWALRELFMSDGWEVHGAEDGEDATRKLREGHYDFVITDLKMPGCSGVDVVREARQRNPHVGVMVLTGYGSFETAVDALRLGAWDYVTKPCDVAYMRKRIAEFVSRTPAAGPAEVEPEPVGEETVRAFLEGEGTGFMDACDEAGQVVFPRLRRVFADLGYRPQRTRELTQICIDLSACLKNCTGMRAGALDGSVLVAFSGPAGHPAALDAARRASQRLSADIRIIQSDRELAVVLCEGLSRERGAALPQRSSQAEAV